MSKLLEIALGIVTGIGGILEAGSLATAAQAVAVLKGTFGMVEKAASLLGLATIAFVVGAWRLHASPDQVAVHLLPSPAGSLELARPVGPRPSATPAHRRRRRLGVGKGNHLAAGPGSR